MKKKDYFALHQTVVETDPRTGRDRRTLRYIGPMYPIDLADLKRRKPLILAALFTSAAAFITAGCLPAQGQRCAYVVPFYILSLLPLYYAVMAGLRVMRIRRAEVTAVEKQEGIESLKNAALGLALLSGAWLIAEGVMLLARGVPIQTEAGFLACAAVQTAASILLSWRMHGIRVEAAQKT